MKLSIVTINYNDARGLQKTLDSVARQTVLSLSSSLSFQLEHIVIDGGSSDNSVDVIKQYSHVSRWISERDKGVYNAMNKGIRLATGDYIQILNAGDILAAPDVLARMYDALIAYSQSSLASMPEILYGNMLKTQDGIHVYRDNCGRYNGTPESFLYFYRGTLNHDCAWIKRTLFNPVGVDVNVGVQKSFGLYDEDMRICSDWKWYVDAIALGGIKPVYVNVDVTVFDMNGISESGGKNRDIIQKERRDYLEQILPASVLRDYDEFHLPIEQYRRLKRYHLWGIVYFVERVLFKLEKWNILKK